MGKIKKKSFSNFLKLLKGSYQDFIDDLQATKWVRGLGWFIGVLWLFSLIASLSLTSLISRIPYFSTTDACPPDKTFRLNPESFSFWSSTGYFQITLSWGHLTFTQAKAIDLVWDIVVGRGGQFLLAFVSWKVFGKYLTTCMEIQPITYQAFRTIFLQNDVSVPSTCGIIRSFIWQKPLRSKIATTFIIITMIFILAFPTLASAMSGYDSNVSSFLPDYNRSYIPFANFSRVVYVIHDGWRLNLTGEFSITEDSPGIPTIYDQGVCPWMRCYAASEVTEYVREYGLDGKRNVASTFPSSDTTKFVTPPNYINPIRYVELGPPVLNISVYATEKGGIPHGLNYSPDINLRPQSWIGANQSYDLTYVQSHGSCQNTGDYQWGFSFLQLIVCLILLILWTVGIYFLWIRAHFTEQLRGRDSSLNSGEHKAVLELASAMKQELGIQHVDLSLVFEKQINNRVNKELKGGAISYASAYLEPPTYSCKKGTKNWINREKWWLAWTVVSSVPCSTVWLWFSVYGVRLWFWSFSLPVGTILAMCIGTSNGSRIILIMFFCTLAALVISFCIASGVL